MLKGRDAWEHIAGLVTCHADFHFVGCPSCERFLGPLDGPNLISADQAGSSIGERHTEDVRRQVQGLTSKSLTMPQDLKSEARSLKP